MLIGYARVSTQEQNLELQLDALNRVGCKKIFTEKNSADMTTQIVLEEALNYLREGDTLVVWRLDRLGRNITHLIKLVETLKNRGIKFYSLQEEINTNTPSGSLIFHIFCCLAQFERDLIRQRTKAGLESARARGRFGGRPSKLSERQKVRLVQLFKKQEISITELCNMFNITKSTLYSYVKKYSANIKQ